jgi:hypothetical protein
MGRQYKELEAARDRLAGTRIKIVKRDQHSPDRQISRGERDQDRRFRAVYWPPTGCSPKTFTSARTFGSAKASMAAAFSLAMIFFGAPLGSQSPCHCETSKPRNPASSSEGMSGADVNRVFVVTP